MWVCVVRVMGGALHKSNEETGLNRNTNTMDVMRKYGGRKGLSGEDMLERGG